MIKPTTGSPSTGRSAARRWALAAGGGAALVLLTAGCSFSGSVKDASSSTPPPLSTPSSSDTSSPAPSDTTSSAPSATSTTSSATAPSTSSAGSVSTTAPAGGGSPAGGGGTPTCTTGQLALSLLPGEGGASAGHFHYTIQFSNRGSACTLFGNPGVSLVSGSSGQQLGAAASRAGTPAVVTLGAGASAYADVSVADTGDYSGSQCQPQKAMGLRVYPPGNTAAAFVPTDQITGCASSAVVPLVVDPVVAGR